MALSWPSRDVVCEESGPEKQERGQTQKASKDLVWFWLRARCIGALAVLKLNSLFVVEIRLWHPTNSYHEIPESRPRGEGQRENGNRPKQIYIDPRLPDTTNQLPKPYPRQHSGSRVLAPGANHLPYAPQRCSNTAAPGTWTQTYQLTLRLEHEVSIPGFHFMKSDRDILL